MAAVDRNVVERRESNKIDGFVVDVDSSRLFDRFVDANERKINRYAKIG